MRSDLPSDTVTFLFTDVEGSARLLHELGAEGYAQALAEHRRVIREACARHGGVEVDTQGDAFFFAFPTAPGALLAAGQMTQELASGPIQVRAGLHTGTPLLANEGYVGGDVHRAARIAASGHGGQVLVSQSTATLVDAELTDLGEHRFKDLSAPERVYQLGDAEFPALKSLYRTNLPVPTTPFLGRERELVEVVGLLEATRLLTLTGPGGTGKTRLATQAAGMAADAYPDGVWWVPLATLREPELVLETAAQVVGSQNGLAEHIADKSMLLLFDNFEQVVEAAEDLGGLLASCPGLDLLVTSREPLHVTGEQEYAVPPLVHKEGVGFFLARARAVKPGFEADDAVSEICRRLDDLPLALELAAARVKALTSTQILERLEHRLPLLTGGARDLPERQRTLRGAIEWSYELLSKEEQRLFARLSVFRGGTLEAAERVCDADLDTLESLVDKSLLRHSDERYWMLETIREYAAENLAESAEHGIHRRHAEWFLALAEEADRADLRWNPGNWLERLEREHDNMRAALDWLEASEERALALRLAAAMWRFWHLRGSHGEGERRLLDALAEDPRHTAARAKALNGAAVMAIERGDAGATKLRTDEALALHRELGDAWGVAFSGFMLGQAAQEGGDFAGAQRLWEDSVRAFREVGDENYALLSSRFVAAMYEELGDRERARALMEDDVLRARALGNREMEGDLLGSLGAHALDDGRVKDALLLLRESMLIVRDLDYWLETALALRRTSRALVLSERPAAAARLLSSSEAMREEMGFSRSWFREADDDMLAPIRGQLDAAAFESAWEEGRKLTADEAIALALAELADA